MNKTTVFTHEMKANLMKLCGVALLWVGLVALNFEHASTEGLIRLVVPVVGFLSFAAGVIMLVDSIKMDVVRMLRREHPAS